MPDAPAAPPAAMSVPDIPPHMMRLILGAYTLAAAALAAATWCIQHH